MRLSHLQILTFAVSLGAVTACSSGKSGSRGPPADQATPEAPAPEAKKDPPPAAPKTGDKTPAPPATPGAIAPAGATYSAKGGDQYTLSTQTKAWTNAEAQPDWAPATASSTKVVARYKDGLNCRYRTAETLADGSTVAVDVGCESLTCSAPDCSTKDLGTADVGTFKGAKGTEQTCVRVDTTTAGSTLIKTVTDTWTHDDALREANIVKLDETDCRTALTAADDPKLTDACAPTAPQVANLSRTLSILTAQTAGSGTTDLDKAPAFSFTASGAYAEPADAKSNGVQCLLANGKLVVTMAKATCSAGNTLSSYSLSVSNLAKQPTTDAPLAAYGAMFSAQQVAYMAVAAGSCQVSLATSADDNWLSGTLTCQDDALKAPGSGKAETVKDATFGCFAPNGFFN